MTRSTAKVIADSIYNGHRLTTLELEYPRYIHSEFMTHRVFSRNAQSTRAIPTAKQIERILKDKWYPIFMKNQAGMQADIPLEGKDLFIAKSIWNTAKSEAIYQSSLLLENKVHKQVASRILEPFSKIKVIVSATEWNNFFRLRIAPDAQQEMQELAIEIRGAIVLSNPNKLDICEWHLPYISSEERAFYSPDNLKKLSTARCARVSYLSHDGERDPAKDLELHDRLFESKHMSPFEHVATPWPGDFSGGNFRGWRQYRYDIENDISS